MVEVVVNPGLCEGIGLSRKLAHQQGAQGLLRDIKDLKVPRVGIPAPMALLSRRHSGLCRLNRLDESTKADHYSRKLYQASRMRYSELPRDRAARPAWGI